MKRVQEQENKVNKGDEARVSGIQERPNQTGKGNKPRGSEIQDIISVEI